MASSPGSRSSAKGPRVDTFVMPPEKHVSVDAHELKMAIKNRLELEDRVVFDDLCKLMEGVANFDFFDLKDRMRTNFLPFASGARNSIYLQRSSKSLPTTPVLEKKEEEFIADVYEVLRASHYTLLTKEEWDLAQQENFNLNLPMEVNWDYMDPDLLKKFWQSSPERQAIRANLPDCMADRILVFHRGIGTEKLSGLLIDQKLDLLMDYTVFNLIDKMRQPLEGLLAKVGLVKKKTEEQQKAAEAAAAAEEAAVAAARMSAHGDGAAMQMYEMQGNTLVASTHKFAKAVERNTLARQCPTLLTLLKAFPTKMELQEPTFKDIVVVYRRAYPARKPPTASANAPNKTKDERMQGILLYRNINIKVFGETPMADVEMIFPEKIVGIKPFQLVNLAVTVMTALMTGALVLWKAGKDINMNIVWTAASLVLTRCFTVYSTAQTQRTMLQQQMTSALYDKMQDSQEGVVSVIMEEMADQQMKQMLLAYMMLMIKGRPLLADDLDNTCEDFLSKEFDHPIDYDLEAALPRLKRWGLLRENAQGKLEAMPMADAVSTLEAAWSTAYKVIGSGSADVRTIDMITGNFSVFGAGIDRFVQEQEQQRNAAMEALGKGKKFIGKTAGGVVGGISTAGTSISAGFGKARGILPFGKSASSAGADPAAVPAPLELPPSTPDAMLYESVGTGGSKHSGSDAVAVTDSASEGLARTPSGGEAILSPNSSGGGANGEKKKEKSSFKKLFKSRKHEE